MKISGFLSSVTLAVAVALAVPLTASPATSSAETATPAPSAFQATIRSVDEETRARMIGVSWQPGCPVPIDDLRIIEMNFVGFDGAVHSGGQLMVHRLVASQVVEAFRVLFENDFPIRRMELIENYGGSDDASMAADNTSAFNCRPITGTTDRFSIHSYGQAIDINTVENPYVRGSTVLPPAGVDYLDRTDVRPGMITKNDVVEKAFREQKFFWGGDFNSLKDYQHFETKKLVLPD
ncbi:M15 family peptidase [Nocardioides guangzhouensis]|uniref:M15 family peptidase n=1 Tax=Nocardioides guangzhouensis TaxID=2497878 RepID=A0A4Q4Z7F9_9ACTN|nr:M15 family metallopeptidase [Nocardioides guangzhouensis]RYP82996.1 M15 family peptidase [Nocardioides guangzhouensis]